jgi:hypothetical protein
MAQPRASAMARSRLRRLAVPPLVILAALPAAAAPAAARGGGRDEVRVSGSCGRGATSDLRLRARDGAIRVRFEVQHARAGVSWRVAVVQDRRVAWRGRARTSARGAFEVERRLRDLPGADRVTVRAWGPAGVTCYAAATLRG